MSFSLLKKEGILIRHIFSLYIFYFGVFFLVLSCSSSDPIIYDFEWQLQAFHDGGSTNLSNTKERLLIQLLANDDDGFEELYEVYIIHDKSELYWRIISDEWKTMLFDRKKWILLPNIETNNFTTLPRGKYRILVRDLSGYSDEKSFILGDNTKYAIVDFPVVKKETPYSITPFFIQSKTKSKVGNTPLSQILQLTYGTDTNEDNEQQQMLYGRNGELYEIKDNKDIYFIILENATFKTYIHKIINSHLILTSDPHILSFLY